MPSLHISIGDVLRYKYDEQYSLQHSILLDSFIVTTPFLCPKIRHRPIDTFRKINELPYRRRNYNFTLLNITIFFRVRMNTELLR